MKIKSLLALAALTVFSTLTNAAELRAGTDYQVLPVPQAVETKGKIEVIEFFSYGCNHCADFDPMLEKWVKALPKGVVFKRIPVAFRESWMPYSRLYYTLEAMQLPAEQYHRIHAESFKAVQSDRVDFADDAAAANWAASKGMDRAKFAGIFSSFSVQAKTKRSVEMARAYGIQGVPTLIVQGKYRPTGATHADLLRITDQLIAKVRAETK